MVLGWRDNANVTDRLALGWEELRRGHWDAARAIFEAATMSAQSAEGFEGLSWAAWWRDDAAAVFAARERAYALYKQRGDRAGAALMATWLAADELDFNGALSVSSGWLGRARRLLEPLEEGPYAPPPAPGAQPPLLWGSEEHVRELFGDRVVSLEMTRKASVERRPGGPRGYCDFVYETFGPVIAIRASAEDPDALDRDFLRFATRANQGPPGGPAEISYEYLLVVARKR